MEFGKFHYTN